MGSSATLSADSHPFLFLPHMKDVKAKRAHSPKKRGKESDQRGKAGERRVKGVKGLESENFGEKKKSTCEPTRGSAECVLGAPGGRGLRPLGEAPRRSLGDAPSSSSAGL